MTGSASSTNSDTQGQPSTDELEALTQEANAAFEVACRTRHAKGEEEYGHNTFLTAPTVEMGLEELADLCNYIRYTYIRLYILNKMMGKAINQKQKEMQSTGSDGFLPMSEAWKT